MSDNRKYYYLKLKENYFDDDSIVLLESMHDYSVDKPEWVEILPGHFVYGNTREMDGYRRELAAM